MSIKANSASVEDASQECGPVSAVRDFWNPKSLDELVEAAQVGPIENFQELLGGWPGDMDDGFEEKLREIRQSGFVGM